MKNIKQFLLAISVIFITVSCSNSADTTVDPPVTAGNWKISYYFDDTDETSDFAAYTFTFGSGGQLTATNGTAVKTGTYSQGSSKFIIDFGTDPLMSELNDDWEIEQITATSIKLKEDNPAQTDRLQFTKL